MTNEAAVLPESAYPRAPFDDIPKMMGEAGFPLAHVKHARTVFAKAAAFDALERLARAGHGPVFTQRSVGIGQRAAMGTGETAGDFAAAIIALEKTA